MRISTVEFHVLERPLFPGNFIKACARLQGAFTPYISTRVGINNES